MGLFEFADCGVDSGEGVEEEEREDASGLSGGGPGAVDVADDGDDANVGDEALVGVLNAPSVDEVAEFGDLGGGEVAGGEGPGVVFPGEGCGRGARYLFGR